MAPRTKEGMGTVAGAATTASVTGAAMARADTSMALCTIRPTALDLSRM